MVPGTPDRPLLGLDPGHPAARKSSVNLRGMLAANKAVRIGEFAISEDGCSMVSRYLRGACRLTAPSRGPQVPPWDLDLVLEALQYPPFEPLSNVDLK